MTGEFLTELQVELLPDGRRGRLTQDLVYQSGAVRLTVPAGFETDFASTPRMFWRWLPPFGRYSRAAVLHDYLYHTGQMPRASADRVFLGAMAATGVPWARRQIIYRGVRLGGWVAWRNHRSKDV